MKKSFSIVVKTVIIKGDRALCLLRSDKEINKSTLNRIDQWDLPGGGMQYYEKLEDCLFRETKEETSLTVSIVKPLDAHDIIRPSLHVVFVTYLSEYVDGEVALSAEHSEYKWASREEIMELPIQKWLKRIYNKAFDEYRLYRENEFGTM